MEDNNKLRLAIGLQVVLLFLFSGIIFNHEAQLQHKSEKIISIIDDCNDTIHLISNFTDYQNKVILNMSEEINNLNYNVYHLEIDRDRLIGELSKEYKYQNELKESIKKAKMESGLINPTYQELRIFVMKDRTNVGDWKDEYDCTEFSNRFIRNFAGEGYYSCTTEIEYTTDGEGYGHIIVAINTTDRGLVYLEPQDDNLISPAYMQKDYNYCSAVDWDCDMEMTKISSCFKLIV